MKSNPSLGSYKPLFKIEIQVASRDFRSIRNLRSLLQFSLPSTALLRSKYSRKEAHHISWRRCETR